MDVENIRLGADLIVVGYISGFPIIIETDQRCGTYIRESFASIGEGSYLAHSSLMHRQHDEMAALGASLYSIYEAKKWAERNRTVGDQTHMVILHKDGERDLVGQDAQKFLHKQFRKYGPKNVPSQLMVPAKLLLRQEKMEI